MLIKFFFLLLYLFYHRSGSFSDVLLCLRHHFHFVPKFISILIKSLIRVSFSCSSISTTSCFFCDVFSDTIGRLVFHSLAPCRTSLTLFHVLHISGIHVQVVVPLLTSSRSGSGCTCSEENSSLLSLLHVSLDILDILSCFLGSTDRCTYDRECRCKATVWVHVCLPLRNPQNKLGRKVVIPNCVVRQPFLRIEIWVC